MIMTKEFSHHTLTNKDLNKRFFADVRFIHTSADGAMGSPGVFEVWTKNLEHYHCYWTDEFDVKKFEKVFMKDEDTPYFDNPVKNGWCFHYMEGGHNFYIKEELNAAYLKKYKKRYLGENIIIPSEEIMVELLDDPKKNDDDDKVMETIKNMESAINKFNLDEDILLYCRADISLLSHFTKMLVCGGVFHDASFTSTTVLEIGATKNEIEVIIKVPKGIGYCAYIAPLSEFPDEHEFVLNRGSFFKVCGIYKDESENFHVKLKVIGRAMEELD